MIIKKLELQGFKSFPDRTKVLFHPGITAVVGPNGTGKSNIVDAILWVLGGQRQKGLRGEKTEDIIFNGNAKKPPLGMADVILSLEHQDEEIVINHRAFRSGESEYRLNGKAARLKDIQDTLWKRAVAEKEYFVIEQGSIGLLITAKPAEKRLLLEEAAGTAFYKDKKKEAQSKLASSEQNLIRLEDIISEVSRAKNSLQRQAQAAARYRKLRERIRELTGLNYKRKLTQLEVRHEEAARQHSGCLDQEKELAFRTKNEERELTDKRREIWELEKSLKEYQEALFGLESQINRTEAEKEREAKKIEDLAEKAEKAAASAQELEQELALLEAEITERRTTLAEHDQALKEKQAEMARATADWQSFQESFLDVEKSLEILKEEQLGKLSELTELRNDGAKADKEMELQARQEAKLVSQLGEERALLESKEEALLRIEKNLAEAQQAKEDKEKVMAGLRNSIEEKQSAVEQLKTWIGEAKKARDEDYYKLQALKKMEETQRTQAGSEEILESLGRLVDLIEASPEYAALVDVLWKEEAGSPVIPALDFIKRAAEKELQGRFLLVSPTQEEPALPVIQDSDVLGFLKSQLRPSPKIKDFLSHLSDAVIVRDVKAAVRLWLRFPALNFMTPKGDVLLSSGLLKLGRAEEGIFVLGQEIKKLEEKVAGHDARIEPLSSELEKKSQEKSKVEENLLFETSLLENLESRIHEQEKENVGADAERERSRSAVSLFERELEFLQRERQALGLKKESLTRKIAALEEEEKFLKTKAEAEENRFLESKGKNVQDEKRFIELRAGADLVQERFNNVSRQLREIHDRQENIQKKLAAYQEENQLAQNDGSQAGEAARILETKSRSLKEERKTKQAGLAQKETDLQRKHAEEEEQEKRLGQLREELERRKEERVKWEIAKAELDRDLVNLEETCWQELKKTLHEVKNEKVEAELSDAQIEEELAQAEEDLQKYKAVNLMAEEEYLGHKERYDFLVQQKNDLRESIDATQEAIRKIDEESKTQFLTALAEVNKHFQAVFTSVFKGGSAEVKLVDDSNPMESGVEIIAQPPGKKVQNIALLSGGEKSLTSLAFLFALFRYKPTPFCILDEVDAALDDANLQRFLDLMKDVKKETQFIIITHNYKTMEVADYIYGTTMAEPNITNLYSVKLEKQAELTS
jgi:chromosome segregation protein